MKIEITGEPKEIAALVLAVQERQPQSALVPKRVIEGSVNATWYGIDVKVVAAILLITHLIIPFFGRFHGQTYSDY